MPGGRGRVDGGYARSPIEPLTGSPVEMADTLRAFAREGIAHVQLVLDPITTDAIRGLAPVLAELDRG